MKLVMETAGDMAIKDLTPKSTNIGDRIVKNLRICGSGIYTYARREAHLLHLDPVPEKYKDLKLINVYRPPEVLEKYKDYFARVPIITGHHVRVDRNNAKDLTVGMVGDTVESEVDKDDGETYLYTTGTIVAGDGVDAYEQYGQLSVGYDPIMEWEEGVHKGVPYQAVLKGFNDVNHLLICKVARGGPQCMVMDSLDDNPDLQNISPLERFVNTHYNAGGEDMTIFKKIFGSAKKEVAGDAAVVSVLLQSIAVGADPETQVQKVREIMGDSINETFNGYLEELAHAKSEKPEVVAKAVGIVDDYYRSHLAGDESKVCPKCGKEPCTCGDAEKKKPETGDEDKEKKPETGDEDKEKKPEEKKPEEKKPEEKKPEAGNKAMGDSIDYDLLADKLAERMAAKVKAEGKTAGDELAVELPMLLAGDTKSDARGSDDFMKDIWG